MELHVYVDKSNDHRHLLRLANEFSLSLSNGIYKDFVIYTSYKNISGEIFHKIIHDLQLRSSNSLITYDEMLICTCKFDVIDKVIGGYIGKVIKQEEVHCSRQIPLAKSTIDDIQKCHKECELILKSCVCEQLGKLFEKEKIDIIYDKIPTKNIYRDNLLSDYICAICNENKEFDLYVCAQQCARGLFRVDRGVIIDIIFEELCE